MPFKDSEDLAARLETARTVRALGFTPVPVIAARRLLSEEMLRGYLAGLQAAGAASAALVVGGDPEQPRGPYPDAGSVIGSVLLEEHGVREISIAGHPGGHPAIADDVLRAALAVKAAALARPGRDRDLGRAGGRVDAEPGRARCPAQRGEHRAAGDADVLLVRVVPPPRLSCQLTAVFRVTVTLDAPVRTGPPWCCPRLGGAVPQVRSRATRRRAYRTSDPPAPKFAIPILRSAVPVSTFRVAPECPVAAVSRGRPQGSQADF